MIGLLDLYSGRYHLKTMELIEQENCQFRSNGKQSGAEHLLCKREVFACLRFYEFGKVFVGPEDFRNADSLFLTGFIT